MFSRPELTAPVCARTVRLRRTLQSGLPARAFPCGASQNRVDHTPGPSAIAARARSPPGLDCLQVLNNMIEVRGDAWSLCLAYQRPTWKAREDIGSWFSVLSIIGEDALRAKETSSPVLPASMSSLW